MTAQVRRVGAIVVTALTLGACVGSGGNADDAENNALEVFGPYREREADRFAEVLEQFEEQSGIDVRYVGSVDFVADLRRRAVEGNDPPDIAIVPQAGLIEELATDGQIVELGETVRETLERHYTPETAALGSIDGTAYAVPFRMSVKSLVWYRPDVFEQQGWEIPQSLDELEALVVRIEEEGEMAPWCFGIQAGTATGWPATDWVEDLVLRAGGDERYVAWVDGDVEFSSPVVADAFRQLETLVLEPGRVLGERDGVVATTTSETVLPMFDDPPGCAMYKQADFAVEWLPDGVEIGPEQDVDIFVLPGEDPAATPPLVVGGDSAVQFRADERVDQLMAYLATPPAAEIWARQGGFLSPNSDVDPETYPESYVRVLSNAVTNAESAQFDASDQMPSQIGSGLLWELITQWVAGSLDYETLANEIDTTRAALPDPT